MGVFGLSETVHTRGLGFCGASARFQTDGMGVFWVSEIVHTRGKKLVGASKTSQTRVMKFFQSDKAELFGSFPSNEAEGMNYNSSLTSLFEIGD